MPAFSGFVLFCATFIVLEDEAIMCVMRFMALLAWIWAEDSSAMSAIWSICWARACFERSIFAFWYAFWVSPFLRSSWICFLRMGSCLAAFCASRRACFAWKRAWNSTFMSRAAWRFDMVAVMVGGCGGSRW